MASAKPLQSPLWPRHKNSHRAQRLGLLAEVPLAEVHAHGGGPPPLLPGPGLGRKEAQAWVWCPTGSAPTGGHAAQPPEDAEGLFLTFPRSHREDSSQGLGVGAIEGWATLGSLSPAQQQRILGKPRLGQAGQWGYACPSTKGGLSLHQGQPQRPAGPPGGMAGAGRQCPMEPGRGAPARERGALGLTRTLSPPGPPNSLA